MSSSDSSFDLSLLGDNAKKNSMLDRRLFHQHFNLSLIGEIWITGSRPHRIILVNDKALSELGFTARQMRGKPIVDLMSKDETIKRHTEKYFDMAFDKGESLVMQAEKGGIFINCRDGSTKKVAITVTFPEEEDGDRRILTQDPGEVAVFGVLQIIFLEDFKEMKALLD